VGLDAIHPDVRIGHVHLGVADLDRAIAFYHDGLGLGLVALLYPGPDELGRAVRRLLDAGHSVDHASDHGATVSVYLSDPDGNGVELYYDRPRERWFDADGRPILRDERIDVRDLLPGAARPPAG
jgi:catechol 2,3-dioxygenase